MGKFERKLKDKSMAEIDKMELKELCELLKPEAMNLAKEVIRRMIDANNDDDMGGIVMEPKIDYKASKGV